MSARFWNSCRALACSLSVVALLAVPTAHAIEVGDRAPQFAARSLMDDQNLSLSKFKGKVVYLDFWASWCGPCAKALPVLDKLQNEFGTQDFQVLAINVDKDLDKAREFLTKHPVGYPSASDPEGRLPEVFKIPTMPTSFLIDRQGVVRHVHPGFREGDVEDLRAKIRELVEGQ